MNGERWAASRARPMTEDAGRGREGLGRPRRTAGRALVGSEGSATGRKTQMGLHGAEIGQPRNTCTYSGGHRAENTLEMGSFCQFYFFAKIGGAGKKMGLNDSFLIVFYENYKKLPIFLVKTRVFTRRTSDYFRKNGPKKRIQIFMK